MPELPEVENLRRGLEKAIVGQKIKKVEVKKPKLVSGKGNVRTASRTKTHEFTHELVGERILAVERRAKNLIFKLSHEKIILAHLKMSGQFVYQDFKTGASVIGGHPIEASEHALPNKHTHIIFELEKGALYYNDTRMFGYVLYYPNLKSFENSDHFTSLGPEPLSPAFTLKHLENGLKSKSGKVKAVIMEQSVVAGLGNIYADESLFAAGILPERKANSLTLNEVKRLHQAIKQIIKLAIKMGGSSVSTYRLLDLSRGNYAREHKVYGKAGKPCVTCKKPLQKAILQGRTTVYCLNCQN